jgi:dynein heavy chain
LKSANEEIAIFEHISDQVKDILECRVENVLNSMSVTSLCDAPLEPCTIDEFTKLTEDTIQRAIQSLSKFIGLSESAVTEILDALKKHLKESDKNQVRVTDTEYFECTAVKTSSDGKNRAHRCYECLACTYFNFLTQFTQRNNEALIQCNFLFKSYEFELHEN